MAKKKVQQKLGIGDLVSLAKSGWTPNEVNALLDRMDEVGDINDPDEPEDDELDVDDPVPPVVVPLLIGVSACLV